MARSNRCLPRLGCQDYWRAIGDNDRRGRRNRELPREGWKSAFQSAMLDQIEVQQVRPQVVRVVCEQALPSVAASLEASCEMNGRGAHEFALHLSISDESPPLPRFGFQLRLPDCLDQLVYYGRGPARTVGIGPQEWRWPASRCPGKRFRMTAPDPWEMGIAKIVAGWNSLLVRRAVNCDSCAVPQSSFSAWPYTIDIVDSAMHTADLSLSGFTTLNLDRRQIGVGGDESWSYRFSPLLTYQLTASEYGFRFVIEPQVANSR